MLLLRDGIAARPGQGEVGGERLLLGDRRLSEACELQPVDQGALLVRLDEGEQGLAAGGAMQRRAPADLDAEAIGAAAAALIDIEHLAIVDGAERGGLARLLGEPVERRRARAAQVEGFPDAVGELEQAVAEPVGVVALLVPDQAEGQQRVEHARQRALGQSGRGLQVAKARRRRRLADHVEQIEALGEGGRAGRDVALVRRQDARFARACAASPIMRSKVHCGSNPSSVRILALDVS